MEREGGRLPWDAARVGKVQGQPRALPGAIRLSAEPQAREMAERHRQHQTAAFAGGKQGGKADRLGCRMGPQHP